MIASNPGMENGGYIMESKYRIHMQLPQHLVPETFLVNKGSVFNTVLANLGNSGISYPFYCKPDIGGRGRAVKKISNETQLRFYHEQSPLNYLVQAAIPYPNEIGIFYCRIPGEEEGFISGIVKKSPVVITGDGIHALKELVEAVPRYYFQRKALYAEHGDVINKILPEGETFILSEIGNHARGSLFSDCTQNKNKNLEQLIDNISKQHGGFYYGRYDIKFNSWDELYQGKNFSIVELNGCGSEPTHMYDPDKSIWDAWKIILYHWHIMYKIARANHAKGVSYISFKEGWMLQQMEKANAKKFKQLLDPAKMPKGHPAAEIKNGVRLQSHGLTD